MPPLGVLVAGGLTVAQVGGGREPLPFLTAQGAWSGTPSLAVTADLAFFTSGDRLFGPRLLGEAGGRWYVRDGRWRPFVGAQVVAYRQFEVTIDFSDASQRPGWLFAAGGSIGVEHVWASGVTWLVEGRYAATFYTSDPDHVPDDNVPAVDTTVGYRF